MSGTVEQIAISPEESRLPEAVAAVEVTDEGVVGDRYSDKGDITLIEAEALDGLRENTGIELSHEESRRQVLTRGIRLNDLVDKRFRVGEVECVGARVVRALQPPPVTHLSRRAARPRAPRRPQCGHRASRPDRGRRPGDGARCLS